MNRRNYQSELDEILSHTACAGAGQEAGPEAPRLFLHSCCAPCSSYCLEYLCVYFEITVFYYNPNLATDEEYQRRAAEQKRLIGAYNAEMTAGTRRGYPIRVLEGDYEPERFYEIARGYEDCLERGERCLRCYELRLRETAQRAAEEKSDYFATTLTLSPLKDAEKLNEIGERLAREYGIRWLPSDFKKRGGYQRSIELSKEYGLYRQNFCGCVYSQRSQKQGS